MAELRQRTSRKSTEDGWYSMSVLTDRVATSLRRQGMKGTVVTVQIKSPALQVISRQTSLSRPTWIRHEIQDVAMNLIDANWRIGESSPIRAITVGVSRLTDASEEAEQTDLLDLLDESGQSSRKRIDKVEAAVDAIRRKHGSKAVTLANQGNGEDGILRR